MTEPLFDSKRPLCPDGACIGVIGPDGRCSSCGREAGQPRLESLPSPSAEGGDAITDETIQAADDPKLESDLDAWTADGGSAFDPRRRLCEDGSCVGIIGDDGRCTVCGAQAA